MPTCCCCCCSHDDSVFIMVYVWVCRLSETEFWIIIYLYLFDIMAYVLAAAAAAAPMMIRYYGVCVGM